MTVNDPAPHPEAGAVADSRLAAALEWAGEVLGPGPLDHSTVAGDASFRRYLRLERGGDSWILMDAPPAQEDCTPFVDVTGRLRKAQLHAPDIVAAALNDGFLLLEDLGDEQFREHLVPGQIDHWMPRLLDLLQTMARDVSSDGLPAYDRKRLQDELELFPEWYLRRHKGLQPDCSFFDRWEDLATRLLLSAEQQPQVFVHRDFHSCNLLLAPDGSIGIIDHQDAVRGPLSYDLASLLWDRYVPWPRAQLERWMEDFRLKAAPSVSSATWQRQVDWMGLQRNLKIIGIFARLHYRDGKAGYLEMIPRFWAYLADVLRRYPEFDGFSAQLEAMQCAP